MEKKKRRSRRREGKLQLELVGGVFLVEEFGDGTQKRDEVDSELVLELINHELEKFFRGLISRHSQK